MLDAETVKVKSDHPEHTGGFFIINKADFVHGVHELFAEAGEDLNQLKLSLERNLDGAKSEAEKIIAEAKAEAAKIIAAATKPAKGSKGAAAPAAAPLEPEQPEQPPEGAQASGEALTGAAGDPGSGWGSGPAGEAQG